LPPSWKAVLVRVKGIDEVSWLGDDSAEADTEPPEALADGKAAGDAALGEPVAVDTAGPQPVARNRARTSAFVVRTRG
jgi:hypothetical protein